GLVACIGRVGELDLWQALASRIAGFGQQALGNGGIEGLLLQLELVVPREPGRNELPGRNALPAKNVTHKAGAVEREREGRAHLLVIERRLLGIEAHVEGAGARVLYELRAQLG